MDLRLLQSWLGLNRLGLLLDELYLRMLQHWLGLDNLGLWLTNLELDRLRLLLEIDLLNHLIRGSIGRRLLAHLSRVDLWLTLVELLLELLLPLVAEPGFPPVLHPWNSRARSGVAGAESRDQPPLHPRRWTWNSVGPERLPDLLRVGVLLHIGGQCARYDFFQIVHQVVQLPRWSWDGLGDLDLRLLQSWLGLNRLGLLLDELYLRMLQHWLGLDNLGLWLTNLELDRLRLLLEIDLLNHLIRGSIGRRLLAHLSRVDLLPILGEVVADLSSVLDLKDCERVTQRK